MNKLRELRDEKYMKISFYTTATLICTFIIGMIVYSLSKGVSSFFGVVGAVLTPILLGAVFAHLLAPAVSWFEKKLTKDSEKSRRGLAILCTYVTIIVIVILILTALIFTITKSVSQISIDDIKDLITYFEVNLSSFWDVVQAQFKKLDINVGEITPKVTKAFGNVTSFVTTLFISNIFAIYYLKDENLRIYWKNLYHVFIPEKARVIINELFHDFDKVFFGYIRGQSMDVVITGTIVSIALTIAGIPYGAVIGLITGIGNFIPYIGPLIGWASLIIVCLSEGNMVHLIVGLVILAIVMTVDSNFINAKLLANQVNVHPVLIMASLIAGGNIGGILGMLLAVPTAAFLKVQFDKLVARKKAKQKEMKETQDLQE